MELDGLTVAAANKSNVLGSAGNSLPKGELLHTHKTDDDETPIKGVCLFHI